MTSETAGSVAIPLTVDSGASTSHSDIETMTFQYIWPLKISKRKVENDDWLILNVSPPFTTSVNGVALTWSARLSDEYVMGNAGEFAPSREHVLASLYYRDGIPQDVSIDEVRMTVSDTKGNVFFNDLRIGESEFTKGSGWPLELPNRRQSEFTDFVHDRVDEQILINIDIKINSSIFNALKYLPSLDRACRSQRIDECCFNFIEEYRKGLITVPQIELINYPKEDKYAEHRRVFMYGCSVVEEKCVGENDSPELLKQIRSQFAHAYFKEILLKETKGFEDFVTLLEGLTANSLPALKREAERHLCRTVMTSDSDLQKLQLLVLLAQRYRLDVLKMVATGVLVDRMIVQENPPEMTRIRHDLKTLASEISHCSSVDEAEERDDILVGSVVDDLQTLSRRIRRVSLSHSPSQSSASSSSSTTATPIAAVPTLSPDMTEQRPVFDSPSTGRFKRVELDAW